MDAGHKERLIRIDVAEAGQQLLVHQPTLDGAVAVAHGAQELRLGHLLRVRPHSTEGGFQLLARAGAYPAEPPHIAKPQLLALVERQQHVGVRLERRLARGDGELPGHAQAHQQVSRRLVIGAELEGERLALALHCHDGAPLNLGCELLRRPNYDARMADLHGKDAASQSMPLEALRNGFDFGEFRHWAICTERHKFLRIAL